jgi:hypothetical protein
LDSGQPDYSGYKTVPVSFFTPQTSCGLVQDRKRSPRLEAPSKPPQPCKDCGHCMKCTPYIRNQIVQCVPLAIEPGISLIILTPIKILQRNLNRGMIVVREMQRNVSVVCVCSAPNCCDTEQRSASQPVSVACGKPYTSKNVQYTGSRMIKHCCIAKKWQFVVNTTWNVYMYCTDRRMSFHLNLAVDIITYRCLTFRGPYITIYSYNKSQRDKLILNFIW